MAFTPKLLAKKRQAFTDIERKDMCDWFAEQILHKSERPHWKKVQSWFSETHNGKVISQSVISRTLLERSADLVGQPLSARDGSMKKRRRVEWPELDEALFLWHKKMQARVPLTSDILKEKARVFFAEIYPSELIIQYFYSKSNLFRYRSPEIFRWLVRYLEKESWDTGI